MHSYPVHFKDPLWAQVFRELPVEQVDAACSHWFKQWPGKKDTQSLEEHLDNVMDTMLMFHELSNRVDANMDSFINMMTDAHESGWGNGLTINAFHRALAPVGWQGIAMRCWTDARGYAGMLQYINDSHGVLALVDDLASNMRFSRPFFEALKTYPQVFEYPWVQAAFVRAAIDGAASKTSDAIAHQWPLYTWLFKSYGVMSNPKANRFERTNVGSIADHPEVNVLLDSPEFWLHSLYQECKVMGGVNLYGTTGRLWASWMKMAGREHPAVPLIAEMSYYRSDTSLILCGLSGRPVEEANVMELWQSPTECLKYLLSNPSAEELTLPSEVATPY